jgi:hypothetical protein
MNDTKTDFRTRDDVTGTAGVPAPPGTSDHKLLFTTVNRKSETQNPKVTTKSTKKETL